MNAENEKSGGVSPQVAVRSPDPKNALRAQDVLRAAGLEAAALRGPAPPARGPDDVLVLDAEPPHLAWAAQEAARARSGPGAVAVAGLAPHAACPQASDTFDVVLDRDAAPAILRRQIEQACRDGVAAAELRARRATLLTLGAQARPVAPEGQLRALFVGDPHPLFLHLEADLTAAGGLVSAAFSSFGGFDLLHDETFDAVVINAARDPTMAFALCGALRRNTRLHNLPTAVVTEGVDQEDEAVERGAMVIVRRGEAAAHASAWILQRMREQRARRTLHGELAAARGPFDLEGLTAPDFLRAHVETMAERANSGGRRLSVAAFHVHLAFGSSPSEREPWRRAVADAAQIVARLSRECDAAALFDDDVLVVAMPGAGAAEARAASERVVAVAECTAFAAGEDDAGPIQLARSIAELAPGESGRALLERAIAGLRLS